MDIKHKTYYTPDGLDKAIEFVKDAKLIMIKAQDFEGAAYLRDVERHLINKQDSDKNRKI